MLFLFAWPYKIWGDGILHKTCYISNKAGIVKAVKICDIIIPGFLVSGGALTAMYAKLRAP
jgi:hypothetical protein